jgi:hypothetical protein
LHWVNPLEHRRKVSTRIRNQESAQAKVNDADGNPIEIAAVVVWQVKDTASALYSVDDFTQFVTIQTETAVRHIASSYPYDNRGSGELSLRENAAEITGQLSAEIADRVRPAGNSDHRVAPHPAVVCRGDRPGYAAATGGECRGWRAPADCGGCGRHGPACPPAPFALQRLEEEGVVELDEERKAAMVSNLRVVLCSEQATQQVVNTGSLY